MQQVNLYQPVLRQTKKVLSAVAIAQIGLVVLLALGGIYAWVAWQTAGLEQRRDQLRAQVSQAQGDLETLASSLTGGAPDPQLIARLAELERRLDQRRELDQQLSQVLPQAGMPFSPLLVALARQPVTDLWLTRIAIDRRGARVFLAGSALDPGRVPELLKRLAEESAYADREFGNFAIEIDPEAGGVAFEAAAVAAGAPGEPL